MNRETRIGIGIVALLGAFVFGLLVIGSIGEPREELQRLTVAQVLAQDSPADVYGSARAADRGLVRVAGCRLRGAARPAGVDRALAGAPLPAAGAHAGAAERGRDPGRAGAARPAAVGAERAPFPSRSEPTGANLRLEQLVFVGHFDDEAAADCAADLREFCRNTFVVSDYDGLVR